MNSDVPPHANQATAYTRSISSRLDRVDEICNDVHSLLERQQLGEHQFTVELLLREFINNAIVHGNDQNSEKRVEVEVRIEPPWITIRIADEGPGFPWRGRRPLVPAEWKTSGRGLAIGAQYARQIQYNDAGNEVTLWVSTDSSKKGDNDE